MTGSEIWIVATVVAYCAIGLFNVRRTFREMSRRFPEVQFPVAVELVSAVMAFTLWPIDLCITLWLFARSMWSQRKKVRHWFLGYWPIIANTANLTSHWFCRRDELKAQLDSDLFWFIDSHIQETAHCLNAKYGVNVGDFPVQMIAPGEIDFSKETFSVRCSECGFVHETIGPPGDLEALGWRMKMDLIPGDPSTGPIAIRQVCPACSKKKSATAP